MLFNKKKCCTWLPAAALVLAAGIGYSCSFRTDVAEPQTFRMAGTEIAADTSEAVTEPDSQVDEVDLTDEEQVTPALVWVHVCGSVCSEGVYGLPEGSRVMDAIDAAGGFSEDADRTCLNLAAVVIDATKVYVPSIDESGVSDKQPGGLYSSQGYDYEKDGDTAARGIASDGSGEGEVKININRASVEELMMLPGIGRTKAEAIIAYREEHGPFDTTEELKKVSGIGDGIYKKLASKVTV